MTFRDDTKPVDVNGRVAIGSQYPSSFDMYSSMYSSMISGCWTAENMLAEALLRGAVRAKPILNPSLRPVQMYVTKFRSG